ncbi:MAG: hypothetical protein KIT68_08140 [Phycisphaeraceae bacterium]|nr:hypothetical protein [Phycisphaeraceae bacterium]
MGLPTHVCQSLHAEFRRRLLPTFLTQMDQASADAALHAALSEELRRLDDQGFAESFAAAMGLGSPTDYLPRVIDVAETPLFCAIRFFGGDRHQAFVDLIAGDAIAQDCAGAALKAMREYSMFEPVRARVLMPGLGAPPVRAGWTSRADQVFAIAPAAAIARAPTPRTEVVDLEPASPDEAAAFVRAGYQRIAEADPVLRARLFPATAEELDSCHAHGNLWWWTIRGARAGLLAARIDRVLGVKGLVIVEELVAASFAGRGTASLAQREMAKRACASCADVIVVGTIDASNAPSRATARRAGRAEVASWHFLSPGDGGGS